jgi:nucleoside-diphosphate-sugar epimerase
VTVYGIDTRIKEASTQTWSIDVQDDDALKSVLNRCAPDVIFQLAGIARVTDEALLWKSHVAATESLLFAVQAVCPRARIVVLGSAAEYGSHASAVRSIAEAENTLPDTAYGRAKLAQSTLAQELGLKLGLDVVRIRLFNTLGPGQGQHLVGGAMVKRLHEMLARRETVLEVYDPESERDYLDVRDVVRLLWLVATEAESVPQRPSLQIASGEATRVLDLATFLLDAAGASSHVEIKPIQTHQPTCYVGRPTTIQQLLGNRPIREFSVKDSLRDMWQWQTEQAL